jgi:hypothetical protein
MSQVETLEDRVARLEKEVAYLRSQLQRLVSKANWIDQVKGSFKDDPEFDEILRLGGEIRRADRPDSH